MKMELTIEQLIEKGEEIKDFIITRDFTRNQLIELAVSLKTEASKFKNIYWLNGYDTLNYPSFASIKLNPRFIILGKEMRSQNDGLIFPQTEPIILVIENFDKLELEDQKKYVEQICRREPHDYNPHNYLHHESIVILGCQNTFKLPSISYKLQVSIILNEAKNLS